MTPERRKQLIRELLTLKTLAAKIEIELEEFQKSSIDGPVSAVSSVAA